ncbi:hypothetical protein [Cellulomonas hominis]|uniref:hypothetical protein n=1 Tax=Cellulomonas hominis TaxID=156981 RepID=UPI001BA42353|nr:hypothetical protein [Cellulomonas hominis]VTR77235.1 hypothetical protein CHMI_02005 [Cellulomonas hominis]
MSRALDLVLLELEERPWTEDRMMRMLRQRYTALRAGTAADRYVRAAHVPTPSTFRKDVDRIADYLVLDTYGRTDLHGFEVKVSRADLLAELRDPAKAEGWSRYCDRWWLVVPDAGIVGDDLPDGWGLLVVDPRGTPAAPRLRAVRAAARLPRRAMPRTVLGQWTRCVAKTARLELHLDGTSS